MIARPRDVIYELPLKQFGTDCLWDVHTIDQLAEVLGGGTPDTDVIEYWDPPEIPWATPTDITGTEGNDISTTERSISKAGLKQSTLVPENSVLMTSRATIGAAKINRVPMAINQGFAALCAKEGHSSEYLFHLLHILQPTLVRMGAGTTFLETSRREIRKVQVRIPEPEEQRRIAAALKLADDAIRKARAELSAAQDLLKSLLKTLFDLGVGASQGLHRSKWTTCPAHWTIRPLKKIATVQSGFTMGRDLSRAETVEVPYVTVVNVQDGRFDLTSIASIEIKREELTTDTLKYGDILMTEGGDRDKLGRGGMWRCEVDPCTYQNHIFRVRLEQDYRPELFHFLIQSYRARNYFYAHAKQTSNLCTINSRELKNWPIAIPPIDEQERMIELLEAAGRTCSALQNAVAKSLDTKRSLLQNLLTGKTRIPEGVASA